MLERYKNNKMAIFCSIVIIIILLMGIFAPFIAPNDPYENDILNKFASPSIKYPLGSDLLGRCVLSRLIFGIRFTFFLSLITMIGTVFIGVVMGVVSGYFRGIVDEIIMRFVDVMLSFPSQIMILAVVALLGVDIKNIIFANIFIKWAWYARMIRSTVLQYTEKNFIRFSKCAGSSNRYILFRHLIPCIASEIIVLATLDTGWAILNISTLSFLGLGVQAPLPEWGAMLSEAKNVMITRPEQMLAPGFVIAFVVAVFNAFGDSIRDVLDPKEEICA